MSKIKNQRTFANAYTRMKCVKFSTFILFLTELFYIRLVQHLRYCEITKLCATLCYYVYNEYKTKS